MRRARCRAIRKAFQAAHGRPPNKTRFAGSRWFADGGYSYAPSEWRRAKKDYLRARSGR